MGCGPSSEHHNGLWFEDPQSKDAAKKLKQKGLLRSDSEEDMKQKVEETFFDDRPPEARTPDHLKEDVRSTLRMGIIRNTKLMTHIQSNEINDVINRLVRVRVKTDDTIYEIGEPGDHVFIVESGEYELWKPDESFPGELLLATTVSGQGAFGEGALEALPRTFTVTVKSEGNIWAFSKESYDVIVEARKAVTN